MERRSFLLGAGGATTALCALPTTVLAKHPLAESSSAVTGSGVAAAAAAGRNLSRSAGNIMDPAYIDICFDSRAISFENPTGARGSGGKTGRGRKGSPSRVLVPGEKVVLADIAGSGTVRHIWMTIDNWPPEVMRALRFEVFYDDLAEPSISVPVLDFFGLPHGRRAEYYSAIASIHEGRGFNSHVPMPFGRSIRMEFTNESARHVTLYYQVNYTLESSIPENSGYLHSTFRRENPTSLRRDFIIADGFRGPGRFLGCSVGIRVFEKEHWYGEGEVKIYLDGDQDFPTICGTGLEDYIGSAWGLGRHYGHYAGTPLHFSKPSVDEEADIGIAHNFVGFYRWHIPDPVMFASDLKVTIQQIGAAVFGQGREADFAAYKGEHHPAARGWVEDLPNGWVGGGLVERVDDYCATAFVYCHRPQPVERFNMETAVRDVELSLGEREITKAKYQVTSSLDEMWDRQEQLNIKLKEQWEQ